MTTPKLTFGEVGPDTWDDFAMLFESKGAPSYCWCMAWRPLPGDRQKASNADRKTAMKRLVQIGTPVGILAYQDGLPVAWCSIAPRATQLRSAALNLQKSRKRKFGRWCAFTSRAVCANKA